MGVFRCTDEPWTYDHEGHPVMVVPDGYGWRELGIDDLELPVDKHGDKVSFRIQIGCSCGWRSQRLFAPLGTTWMPHCVLFPDDRGEDAVSELWSTMHRDHITDDSPSAIWQTVRARR